MVDDETKKLTRAEYDLLSHFTEHQGAELPEETRKSEAAMKRARPILADLQARGLLAKCAAFVQIGQRRDGRGMPLPAEPDTFATTHAGFAAIEAYESGDVPRTDPPRRLTSPTGEEFSRHE